MNLFEKIFGFAKKDKNELASNAKGFNPSDALLDEAQFWNIIQSTKDRAKNDFELQKKELENELKKLSFDDIILFGNRFRYYRGLANTWELWGAIYLIHGGCSDDSFSDFREWVIAQGKEFYFKTIADPDSLAEVENELIENAEWEGFGYIPSMVFERLFRKSMPTPFKEQLETKGNEWEEDGDDLKKMLPRLYAKYSDDI